MWPKSQRYQVFAGVYRHLFCLENHFDQVVDEYFFGLFEDKESGENEENLDIADKVEDSLGVFEKQYESLLVVISQFLKDPNKTNLTHLAIFFSFYIELSEVLKTKKEDAKFLKNLINKYLNLLDEIGDKQSTGFVHAVLSKIANN